MKIKFQKTLSILLTVAMILSVGVCAFGTATAAESATYYVHSTGSDTANGLTETTPIKTVSGAIQKAKANGLGEDDTVYVKLTEWSETSWGAEVDFDFDLIVSSIGEARYNLSIPNGFKFGGDVTFENVMTPYYIDNVYYNNHNVIFDKNCIALIKNHYLGAPSSNAGTVISNPQIVDLAQSINTNSKNITLSDASTGGKTYSDDVTLNIRNEISVPSIKLGAASGSTTFEKNLNINIMDSASVEFVKNTGAVTVNGALQVIVNSDTAILTESKEVLKAIGAKGGLYYITNATRVGDLIIPTATAGTYAVDTARYAVKAKNASGEEFFAQDGLLVLPQAGEYVVTVEKEVETPIYYVSADGDSKNAGLTPEAPLSAINEVITAAVEAGYWEGDTVYVNVIGSSVDWSNEFVINSTTQMVSPEYDYLLCVQSYNKASPSTVDFVYRQVMTGDVEFDNIKLNFGSSSGARVFHANNHNVILGENVTVPLTNFAFGTFNGSGKFDGQSIVIKNALNSDMSLGNDGHHNNRRFSEDVTLVLDNKKIKTRMYTTCYHGGITTMSKNLNIDIKAAESVEFRIGNVVTPETVSKIDVLGAVQLIVNQDVLLSAESINTIKGCSVNDKFYYLTNASGIKDLLTFTETAGKYALTMGSERCTVYAINSEGEIITSSDGYLTLPEPGEYLIGASVTAATEEYYVSALGNDTNDGQTASSPFATIEKALACAKANGCVRGDTVVIKVLGSEFAMPSLPSYEFDLKIVSASSSEQAVLNFNGGATIANSNVGMTTYENVKIALPAAWRSLVLAGNSVMFGTGVKFSTGYTNVGALTHDGGGAYATADAQKMVFEGSAPYSVGLSNTGWANVVRNGDIELVFNNSSISTSIGFNAYYNSAANGNTTYNKNINLDIKSASSIGFKNTDGATVNSAIQIIDSQGLGITPQTEGLADIDCQKWIINNQTGVKDALAFTETAGKFAVDTDKYMLTVTDSEGNPFESEYGYLVLSAAGEYTVTFVHKHTYTDVCDDVCDTCPYTRQNAHDYENTCDTECNKCSLVREIKHTYDNNCDMMCNVCNDVRSIKHAFTNGCDTTCNVCGIGRFTTHIYDKVEVIEATINKDGSIVNRCRGCGIIQDTYAIAYPKSITLSATSYTYDGKVKAPTVNVEDANGNMITPSNYTVTYSSGRVNAGTYKVTVKFMGYYLGSKELSFKINPIVSSGLKVSLSATSYTYDGKSKTPTVTVKDAAGKALKANTDYTVSYSSGRVNVGTYKATVKFKGNYSGSKELSFKVNPAKSSTLNLKLSATSYTYNGKAKTPTVTVKDAAGKTLKANTDYTVTYPTGRIKAGTYKVKVVFKGKYSGTEYLTFKVNPVKSTKLTAKLSTTTYTYNGKSKKPTVTVKDSAGKTLKANTDYTVTYPSGRTKAGTYKVKVVFKGNYSGTKYLTFKINPIKSSKLIAKLSKTSHTYTGKAISPTVVVKTAGGKTLKKNTDYTVIYQTARKNVGNHKVKITFKGNYSGTKYLYFKILPSKTPVSKVTAGKKSLKVTIKKQPTQATGYQIQYSTSKTFKSAKIKTVNKYSTTSATLKGLKAKKTYYVRVRTYKKVGSKLYYSGWSSYKSQKTK